jgi:hypothetical protein
MNTIALLGAGFSRNWGGRLAVEMRSDIIGRLAHLDPNLIPLFDNHANFEDVLARLQSEHISQNTTASRERFQRMQSVISDAFGTMNGSLANLQFEINQSVQFSVRKFLSRFDAIFTTNQDLLLELNYNSVELFDNPERQQRWGGWEIPGMRGPANWHTLPRYELVGELWSAQEPFELHQNTQPLFKLHGSVNWRDSGGQGIMIVGRDKGTQIAQHRVLAWYFEHFRSYLCRPDTRVMALGYSFSDPHIDQELNAAHAATGQLRIFYFGPRGREVLNKSKPTHFRMPHVCDPIPVLGESTRDFRQTFAGDAIEFENVSRFFQPPGAH